MSSRDQFLNELTTRAGLQVHTYSPGDGITRYRFFPIIDGERQDYFGPRRGIATVLRLSAAFIWIKAYIAGQDSKS